jgi:hypothetical protein
MKRTRTQQGFALFVVIVLLAVVTAAVALSLDEAVSSIQNAGRTRASELIRAGLDHGLNVALNQLQQEDPASLADPTVDYDIFRYPSPGPSYVVPDLPYPATGDYQNNFRVRVGIRPGQRTRAPEGEDVTKAYGQIVEVQISVDTNGPSSFGLPPAEERVAVGVLIPRSSAHAQ